MKTGILLIVIVVLVGGAAALWYFNKQRKLDCQKKSCYSQCVYGDSPACTQCSATAGCKGILTLHP